MKKKWKIVLCIALAAVVLGGSLTAWLLTRTTPDTDPDAPFRDLSSRGKRNALNAIENYWKESPRPGPQKFVWYEKPDPYREGMDVDRTEYLYANHYGLRYYGTFNGYQIIFCAKEPLLHVPGVADSSVLIGGWSFTYPETFFLFAYRDGTAVLLQDAYRDGWISYEQLRLIHQCYDRYNEDVYILVGNGDGE